MNEIEALYQVVEDRKTNPVEGSYTCYLFEKGLDKILKKVGEECTETIIEAKNGDNEALKNEICDLLYHLVVMMSVRGLPVEDVMAEMEERAKKIGNAKVRKTVDHNT